MLIATLLLAASMVVGQAGDASPHYQHLKNLEYFAGVWEIVGKVEVKDEFSGLDELTEAPLRQVVSYEWFKNKNFMVWTVRDTPDAPISYQGVIGW